MADEEQQNTDNPDAATKTPVWQRFLTKKRLAVVAGLALIVPALGYAAIAASSRTATGSVSPEVSLGSFWYETTSDAAAEQIRAEFKLHLQLLEQVDLPARTRLEARQFKVQQDIEELLRRAHNGDFEDPSLTELKRQIQVQINQTLGMRGAIEEVIVTDLVVHVLEVKQADTDDKKPVEIYRKLDGTGSEPTNAIE
jgi:flagellar basal body-associated protein FliL